VCKTLLPWAYLPHAQICTEANSLHHNLCRSVTHQENCVTCHQAVFAARNESMLVIHGIVNCWHPACLALSNGVISHFATVHVHCLSLCCSLSQLLQFYPTVILAQHEGGLPGFTCKYCTETCTDTHCIADYVCSTCCANCENSSWRLQIPTQTFFTKAFGLPLRMEPDLELALADSHSNFLHRDVWIASHNEA